MSVNSIVANSIVSATALLALCTPFANALDDPPSPAVGSSENSASRSAAAEWPEWDRFTKRFVQADGRVIDVTFDQKTTSEGQAYAMFFALVANQRDRFDTLLKWSSDNLAEGQLGAKLPGWLWGKKDDGSWGIKDRNMASDADLWMAYTLLEASRLWNDRRYEAIGRGLLKQVAEKDVVKAGSAGIILLPGPVGFALSQNRYRLNPSYWPGFMFAYFRSVDPAGPWGAVWDNYVRLAPKIYASGVAPDDFIINTKGETSPDSEREPLGSYDAIRVYLWAAMSGENSAGIVKLLKPYAELIRANGKPPEKVSPVTGKVVKADFLPMGFAGASLPFLRACGEQQPLDSLREQLKSHAERAKDGAATNYYDQVLILFGEGYMDGYYKFDAQGRVQPRWNKEG